MSSCDRRSLLIRLGALAATLPVTACGFTPAYAPGAAANTLRNSVVPDDPANRMGYYFIRQIQSRLGPAPGALEVNTSTTSPFSSRTAVARSMAAPTAARTACRHRRR